MEAEQYVPIVKRVGAVLVMVGLLDICYMIYCIMNRIAYSSSLNIFAVIVGIFLVRGSLTAAAIVRWFATFSLSAACSSVIALLAITPLGLVLTYLRLYPRSAALDAAMVAVVLLFGLWIVHELSRRAVQSAMVSAGLRWRSIRIPAVAGAIMVAISASVVIIFIEHGASADRAKSMAKEQVGPGYSFVVSSLNFRRNDDGTSVTGEVTAWNEKEIREISVSW
jgi:hypothetical protein